MTNANHRSGYRAAQRYRRTGFGLILFGAVAAVVGGQVGFGLGGLVLYVLGAVAGFGLLAYVRLNDSLSLGDERLCELERRASHYAVVLFGVLGWIGLVGASLLDAAGTREMTATEGTLLWAFAAFFLAWGAIYALLRLRR